MALASGTKRIIALFKYLDNNKSQSWAPDAGVLADGLRKAVENNKIPDGEKSIVVYMKPELSGLFATAAIEMWHRSIHSFLISCSISKTSPIWSSVSGYYSSHYAIRAFSHLLGFYALYKKGTVQVQLDRKFHCEISKRKPKPEHQEYWLYLKEYKPFHEDPVFSENRHPSNVSSEDIRQNGHDALHRSKANYLDHINSYVKFEPLCEDYLITRIRFISDSITESPLFPNPHYYPDLDAVQLIAYARLIKFRRFLDDILDVSKSKYWKYQRNPDWCSKYMDYQATELRDLDMVIY